MVQNQINQYIRGVQWKTKYLFTATLARPHSILKLATRTNTAYTHTHTQHTPIVLSSMVLSCYSVHAVEVIRADLDRAFLGSRLARQL